ncbi:hypothetical protein [Salmon gill poxvirus]
MNPSPHMTCEIMIDDGTNFQVLLTNPEAGEKVLVDDLTADIYRIRRSDEDTQVLTRLIYDFERSSYLFSDRSGKPIMEILTAPLSFRVHMAKHQVKQRRTRGDRQRRLELWLAFVATGKKIEDIQHFEQIGDTVDGDEFDGSRPHPLCICNWCMNNLFD